jgi:hypothetical protein
VIFYLEDASSIARVRDRRKQSLFKEHLSKFSMGEGEGPKSKIRSSIRNRAQHKLNSLNSLMNENFAEGVVMFGIRVFM